MPDVYATCSKDDEHRIKPRHVHEFNDLNSIETNEISDEPRTEVPKDQYLSEQKKALSNHPKISPSQIFSVKMLYIHKDYDGQFFNNIAVLELDRKVSFLNGVNVIGISTNTSDIKPGDVLSLYGWDKVSDLPFKKLQNLYE